MKKIIYLSTLLVFLFTVSGCNLFEDADKPSDGDAEVFYYNANLAINSGDQDKLAELETQIEERIISNPEEGEALTLMLAEVRLGLSGVDLLKTATDIFDMIDNADSEVNITTAIGKIKMTDEQIDSLKESKNAYNDTLDTTLTSDEIAALTSEERNTYMSAGIANLMYSANVLLNVFDTNNDEAVNDDDKLTFENFNQTEWATTNKNDIANSLIKTVEFLNIAFQNNTSDAQATTDNEELVQKIEDIKTESNSGSYDTITTDNFDTVINFLLTGKEAN